MKSFNYTIDQPLQRRVPVSSYIFGGMLVTLAVFAILLVLGYDPAVEFVGKIAELVIGGLK